MDMLSLLEKMPKDALVMGNIDPAGLFRNGDPAAMEAAVLDLMDRCGSYANFIPSSGCDVPPATPWVNIEAFYNAVNKYYSERN